MKHNKYFLDAIDIVLKNTKFNFDQTKVGRVTEVLDNNKYKVLIHGKTKTIKSEFHFSVGERVFVLFPCGSEQNLYIYPNR